MDVALDVVPNVKPEEEVVPEEEEVLVPNVKPEEEVVAEEEEAKVSPEDDVVEDESPNVIPVAFWSPKDINTFPDDFPDFFASSFACFSILYEQPHN